MEQDNPFVKMAQQMMPNAKAPRICTGVVLCAAPLAVNAEGLTLSGGDLRVNAALLARTLSGTVDGRAASIRIPGELAAGDSVLLLTDDGQTYQLLCKEVAG